MMQAKYDAKVFQEYADRLYLNAQWIIFKYICLGLVVGAGLGYAFSVYKELPFVPAGVVCALIFGFLGYHKGREEVFHLLFEAQEVLWKIQVEFNLRRQ